MTSLNPPSLGFTLFKFRETDPSPANQSSPLINHQNILGGVGEYGICALQSLCSLDNYMNMGRRTALSSDARRRALRTKDHQVMFEKTILDFFLLVLCWMSGAAGFFQCLSKSQRVFLPHQCRPYFPAPSVHLPQSDEIYAARYAFSAFSSEFCWAWLILSLTKNQSRMFSAKLCTAPHSVRQPLAASSKTLYLNCTLRVARIKN